MVKSQTGILGVRTVLLAASTLIAFAVSAEAELDRIVVVGQRIDGGALTCMSALCFDTANEQAAQALLEWQQMYQTFPQEELPLDAGRFCRALSAKQPAGCSVSSPPASPGLEGNWQPTGCGTGVYLAPFSTQRSTVQPLIRTRATSIGHMKA